MFPGSAPQEGYPRSSAVDWLDCAESLSPPTVDDFSMSLSPPAGRQELRETWRADRQDGDPAGSRKDRHWHQPKYRQDSGSHIWAQCTCQNKALGGSKASLVLMSLLSLPSLLVWGRFRKSNADVSLEKGVYNHSRVLRKSFLWP